MIGSEQNRAIENLGYLSLFLRVKGAQKSLLFCCGQLLFKDLQIKAKDLSNRPLLNLLSLNQGLKFRVMSKFLSLTRMILFWFHVEVPIYGANDKLHVVGGRK